MCVDPVSMMAMAGAGLGALNTLSSGLNAASVARYNQRQQENATYSQERLMRENARKQIGSQAVTLANSGAQVDTATPLLLLGESQRNASLDALAQRQTGLGKALNYKLEAQSDTSSAIIGAGAHLLGGASQLQKLGAINPPGGGGVERVNLTPSPVTGRY